MIYFLTNFKNYIPYIIAAFIGYFFYKYYIYPLYISPLCRIPGPPVERLFFGNLISFFKNDPDIYLARLKEQYGGVVLFRSFFNSPVVVITDHKLIQHILVNNTYDYVRAIADRPEARDMLGKSIFVVEGNVHKRQRKIMNPAFSFTNIKGVFPTVVQIVNKLKDSWMKQIGDKNEGTITVTTMLPKIALDIIGLVGFGYEFNSTTTESELARAYETITSEKQTPSYFMLIIATIFFPFISKLPFGRNLRFQKSLKVIKAYSDKIVLERKNKFSQGKLEEQDLLSILVRINDELSDGEKLTHEELKSQVMSFLIAGHETTSTASTWALYLLAKHPDIQNRLREELVEAFPDRSHQPTFDEIECLKYLDCVIKEALRVIPPVPSIPRRTTKDETMNGYFIPKGTLLIISIYGVHHDSSLWGKNASKFEPSKWLDPEMKSKITNSIYLPFINGPKNCMGMKFALMELKVILAILIRNFAFKEVEGYTFKKRHFGNNKPLPGLDLIVSKVDN